MQAVKASFEGFWLQGPRGPYNSVPWFQETSFGKIVAGRV